MTDTSSPRSLRVFLCHSSADKPAVRELYQRLQADGIDVWLDEENLLPGQDWGLEIPKAVRESDAVIVCLSRGAINKAGYVQKEITFALDVADQQPQGTIFLIPLKLEECDVPERLRRWQWVNLLDSQGYARLLRALRFRAATLGARATSMPVAPASQSPAAMPSSPSTDVSGGVNIAGDVRLDNDVVGRDKIIQADTSIERAAFVQPTPPLRARDQLPPPSMQTWGGVEFVRVPAGKFLMGSQDDDALAFDNEKPQHTVEIPYDYWMGRYPVTNEQFASFAEAANLSFDLGNARKRKAHHPVVNVLWYDALEYCQWLNMIIARDLPGVEMQVRLPTEAEWEKASRGEGGRLWPWGNEFDPRRCNSGESGRHSTTSVKVHSPQGDSPYGVVDMVGNVWEWCHSLYDPYPYEASDGREREGISKDRVVRGGSFNDHRSSVRTACRLRFDDPDEQRNNLGFRVVIAPRLA